MSPPIVVDYQRDGRTVKGLVNVARDGYLWQLERTKDKINFVAGQPYVRQNVFKSLDPKTGRPEVDEARKPGTNKTAEFCPSLWGGKDWPPAAYSPQTRMLYIPANDNLCTELTGEVPKYVQGERFMGVAKSVMKMVAGADHIGELQAWDLDTGKKVWTTNLPSFNWGPVLATGGGLLFAGGTNDRLFRAFDAKTGKILWEFPTGSGRGRGTGLVSGRRQAIHRGAVRLGRRPRENAGADELDLPRPISGGSPRRHGLGVRGEVAVAVPRIPAPQALPPGFDPGDLSFSQNIRAGDGLPRQARQ